MQFIPSNSLLFRSAIDALKDFLPSAQMCIGPDGIKICGVDASHIGYVDYFLSVDDSELLTLNDGPMTLGINMITLARVLGQVNSGDKITLSVGKNTDKLNVSYINDKMAKKSVYELCLLDIDCALIELPETTYNASVKARTADIAALIKEVAQFGDVVGFRLDEDGFHVFTEGDISKVQLTLENTEDREMTLEISTVSVSFAMKCISNILKGCGPLSPTVSLEFDDSQPLKAAFRFGEKSYFNAYLAPRVIDD